MRQNRGLATRINCIHRYTCPDFDAGPSNSRCWLTMRPNKCSVQPLNTALKSITAWVRELMSINMRVWPNTLRIHRCTCRDFDAGPSKLIADVGVRVWSSHVIQCSVTTCFQPYNIRVPSIHIFTLSNPPYILTMSPRVHQKEKGTERCGHQCEGRNCVNAQGSLDWNKEGSSVIRHQKSKNRHPHCNEDCPLHDELQKPTRAISSKPRASRSSSQSLSVPAGTPSRSTSLGGSDMDVDLQEEPQVPEETVPDRG